MARLIDMNVLFASRLGRAASEPSADDTVGRCVAASEVIESHRLTDGLYRGRVKCNLACRYSLTIDALG